MKKKKTTLTALIVTLISLVFGAVYFNSYQSPATLARQANAEVPTVGELYANRISGVMVQLDGWVVKKLPDDNEGSRHQRFIVKLDGDITVLIAHNIDLAPRVPIDNNKKVTAYGQYEWNHKGGVVHWTHHDPAGDHEQGWIEYQGKMYQ